MNESMPQNASSGEMSPLEEKIWRKAKEMHKDQLLTPEQVKLTAELISNQAPENEDEFIEKSIDARIDAAVSQRAVNRLKLDDEGIVESSSST